MIDVANQGLACLTAATLCACVWLLRRRAREHAEARVTRLDQAATLLGEYATALERFLGAAEPADDLKRLLVGIGDASGDATAMRLIAARADATADDPEVGALIEAMARLHAVRPDLEDDFWTALDAALAAAMLRWAETQGGGDLPLLRTAGSPSRRIGMAVAAAHRHAAPAV